MTEGEIVDRVVGVWTRWPVASLIGRMVVLAFLGFVIDRVVGVGIRALWAFGIDRRQHIAYFALMIRLVLVVAVTFGTFGTLHQDHPMAALTLALLLASAASIWGLDHLRDFAGGAVMTFTKPFHLGDEVEIRGERGRVVRLGLTRVTVRRDSGLLVGVPTRLINRGVLHTAPDRRSLPIELSLALPEGLDANRLRRAIMDEVYLSSWTDAAAPILVELIDAHHARIVATPVCSDEADDLRSDLIARAGRLGRRTDLRSSNVARPTLSPARRRTFRG